MVDDIVRYPQKWGSELTTHITFALEDRIDALVTKDTNKVKVYTDSYDGHCLRAYSYFPTQMRDIQMAKPDEETSLITLEDGSEMLIKSTDVITYMGKEVTYKELLDE